MGGLRCGSRMSIRRRGSSWLISHEASPLFSSRRDIAQVHRAQGTGHRAGVDQTCPFRFWGGKKLERGAAVQVAGRLEVAARSGAVSWRGAGKWPELVWSAGIFLREWGRNSECRIQNAEFRMRSAECGVRNAEWGVRTRAVASGQLWFDAVPNHRHPRPVHVARYAIACGSPLNEWQGAFPAARSIECARLGGARD